jgi:2-dehydro-3-deoxygluconokinase
LVIRFKRTDKVYKRNVPVPDPPATGMSASIRVSPVPIAPVDTVGAGDAGAAGYLSERCAGSDATTRLRTAAVAGAYACLHPGGWQGGIRRSELASAGSADPVSR